MILSYAVCDCLHCSAICVAHHSLFVIGVWYVLLIVICLMMFVGHCWFVTVIVICCVCVVVVIVVVIVMICVFVIDVDGDCFLCVDQFVVLLSVL